MPWWHCAALRSSFSLFFVNLKHLQVYKSYMIKLLIFVLVIFLQSCAVLQCIAEGSGIFVVFISVHDREKQVCRLQSVG